MKIVRLALLLSLVWCALSQVAHGACVKAKWIQTPFDCGLIPGCYCEDAEGGSSRLFCGKSAADQVLCTLDACNSSDDFMVQMLCNAVPANAAPTATDVSISGTVGFGQTLTGSYTYDDADTPKDEEGTSTFKWYSSTKADCSDKTAISGATSKTYTIQASDAKKFICFGVTPVATSGTSPGTEVIKTTSAAVPGYATECPYSASTCGSCLGTLGWGSTPGVFCVCYGPDGTAKDMPPGDEMPGVTSATCATYCEADPIGVIGCKSQPTNAAPTATDISITGTVAAGQTLTGSYTYADAESNAEGTSTFKWYTGTDAKCSGKTAITGATSKTYTIQASDVGKFICFGVTPVATSGTSPGTEVIKTTSAAVPATAGGCYAYWTAPSGGGVFAHKQLLFVLRRLVP